ncbi:MAG: hypothetical protein GVY12_08580 [Bacteroidetes bacterium]|nr:hypothetical protein [Bacteroidota bacterium]
MTRTNPNPGLEASDARTTARRRGSRRVPVRAISEFGRAERRTSRRQSEASLP